ncbi:MAG: hypothetical protein NPIRA05_05030 [Nitrospirales bacterium]|nr:MAG: hypothetical protein NPIRA05_05030 [Nitrospirales bacterium]
MTPFFNAESYLEDALTSVAQQSYSNWELLLVNDGSTDRSREIALDFASKDRSRVHYLEHAGVRNLGKSTSRNLGISRAKGKYLCFLDADDVFMADKISRQVQIFDEYPNVTMVFGNTLWWYSWKGAEIEGQTDYVPDLCLESDRIIEPPSLIKVFLGGMAGKPPCICSVMVKSGIVRLVNGFDENIQHLYEDQVLLAKLLSQYSVVVTQDALEKYRQRDDSDWHQSIQTGEDLAARCVFIMWLDSYLSSNGIDVGDMLPLLKSELRGCRHPDSYRVIRKIKSAVRRLVKVSSY